MNDFLVEGITEEENNGRRLAHRRQDHKTFDWKGRGRERGQGKSGDEQITGRSGVENRVRASHDQKMHSLATNTVPSTKQVVGRALRPTLHCCLAVIKSSAAAPTQEQHQMRLVANSLPACHYHHRTHVHHALTTKLEVVLLLRMHLTQRVDFGSVRRLGNDVEVFPVRR